MKVVPKDQLMNIFSKIQKFMKKQKIDKSKDIKKTIESITQKFMKQNYHQKETKKQKKMVSKMIDQLLANKKSIMDMAKGLVF